MKQLEIIDTDIDGITVVAPVGEIDLVTAPLLREHLRDLFFAHPHHVVIRLDLVSFLDSSGVSVLVIAYRRAREEGIEFRLAAPTDQVAKVLDVTGIDTFIPTFTSLRAALKPLPQSRGAVPPAAHDSNVDAYAHRAGHHVDHHGGRATDHAGIGRSRHRRPAARA